MNGIGSSPADVRFLIVFVTLFLLIAYSFARAPKPLPSLVSIGTAVLLVGLGIDIVLGGAIVWGIRPNQSLLQLDANRVAAITVDSTRIEDRVRVGKIVDALRQNHMYAPNIRKWGKPVPFRIALTSGEIREYRIVRDLQSHAAIIEFLPKYGIEWGYALSYKLDAALDEASVDLPD